MKNNNTQPKPGFGSNIGMRMSSIGSKLRSSAQNDTSAQTKYVPPSQRYSGPAQHSTGMSKYTPANRSQTEPRMHHSSPKPTYSSPWEEKDWYPPAPRAEAALFSSKHNAGINFQNYQNIPVHIEGEWTGTPIDSYSHAGIHPLLKKTVELLGYKTPTPIQTHGMPVIIDGQDLMACAQTGSGKTAAFILPIFSKIMSSYGPPNAGRHQRTVYPLSVILAPTRELALQIFEECEKFAYRTWLSICAVYGGASPVSQLQILEKGCDVLIATPGRLKDFVGRGRVSLSNVQYLVLDEADRMLDMGFEPQIRELVERTDMTPKKSRQTMMYSATFPRAIQKLAQDFLRAYVFVTIGRIGAASENITQEILYVDENDKPCAVLDVLEEVRDGQTLVFVERKIDAGDLESYLLTNNISAVSIHGDKVQQQREQAMNQFKKKRAKVLVATAVAARGLDIPDVACVINFDFPKEIDEYVHKIGRTGRAGNTGRAVSFINNKDLRLVPDLLKIMQETGQPVPDWLGDLGRRARW